MKVLSKSKNQALSALKRVWLYHDPYRKAALKMQLTRDGYYVCPHCNQLYRKLQVHHLVPVTKMQSDASNIAEVARSMFVPEVLAVCAGCHRKAHRALRKKVVSCEF